MSRYTHWVCFECRKSFHHPPSEVSRTCPDCGNTALDMGVYFKPPRRQAKRRWEVMRLLASSGYRFASESNQYFIENILLPAKNPSVSTVKEIIVERRTELSQRVLQSRISWHKENRKRDKDKRMMR